MVAFYHHREALVADGRVKSCHLLVQKFNGPHRAKSMYACNNEQLRPFIRKSPDICDVRPDRVAFIHG